MIALSAAACGILRDISLQIAPGEVVALVGDNGSGKSTLARLLCADTLAERGRVRVDVYDPASSEDDCSAVRRLVGLVQQDPADQIVSTLVFDEVAFGPRNIGLDEGEVSERVERALGLVGLAGYDRRTCTHLSGGELQRVALAGILALEPRYLVLDEVTAQLDSSARPSLRRLFRTLSSEHDIGVVHITHDPLEVLASDRVLLLEDGRLTWSGDTRAFARERRERLETLIAGDVYAQTLVRALEAGFSARGGVEPEQLASWLLEAPVRREAVVACTDASAAVSLGEPDDAVTPAASEAGAAAPPASCGTSSAVGADTPSCDDGSEALGDVPGAHGEAEDASAQPDVHASGDASPVLEMRRVSFSYGEQRVLRDVSLSVASGRVLLLAGRSGSGKSTLARIAAGLLAPEVGEALLAGKPVSPGGCGLAFQRPEAQFFLDTVRDELAFAPRNFGVSAREVERRVQRATQAADVADDMLERCPFELSGGEGRRVALASVLMLAPRAYVLDEPSAGLDAAGRRFAHALVRELAREQGAAVIVVTHDVGEWLPVCDEVALLHEGRVGWRGDAASAACEIAGFERCGLKPLPAARLTQLLDGMDEPGATEAQPSQADDLTEEIAGAAGAVASAEAEADASGALPAGDAMTTAARDNADADAGAAAVRDAAPAAASASALGRLDARVRLIALLLSCAAILAARSPVALLLWTVLLGGCACAAHMDVRRLAHSLRPLAIIAVLTLCANLFACDGGAPVEIAGPFGVNPAGAMRGLFAVARIMLMAGLAFVMASVTTSLELADACVRLLRPLARAGVPVGQLGAALSLALRFVPLTVDELARIRLAQRARGLRFDEGNVLARVRAWAAVLTPLVVGLMRRADRLGASMAARCYAESGTVPLPVPRRLAATDRVALLVVVAAALALAAVGLC